MDHPDEIDTLYAVPPAAFVSARKDLATRLKKAGNKADAERVAALTKPNVPAWAVNQLYRRDPDQFNHLLAAGAALRDAHRRGPNQVREAQRAQRSAVELLVRQAQAWLQELNLSASDAVLSRVTETLTAISTLNRWGSERPGQLTRELEPPGFDALAEVLGDMDAIAVQRTEPKSAPATPAKTHAAPATSGKSHAAADAVAAAARARREAEAQVAAAEQAQERVQARIESAQHAAEQAAHLAKTAETQARRLAEALKAAEAALVRAKHEASGAAETARDAIERADAASNAATDAERAGQDANAALKLAHARLAATLDAEAALNAKARE